MLEGNPLSYSQNLGEICTNTKAVLKSFEKMKTVYEVQLG